MALRRFSPFATELGTIPVEQTTVEATPSVVALTTVVPAPTATGDAAPTPTTVTLTTSTPAPTGSGTSVATPSTITLTVVTDAPTASGDGTASPASIDLTVVTPSPTVTGTSAGEAAPAAITLSAVTDAPTASGDAATSPTAITLAATVPDPTATGSTGGTATPSAVDLVVVTPSPAATGSTGGTASPASIDLTVVTPAPAASAAASPAAIVLSVSVPCIVPPNDNWADATALVVGLAAIGFNCGATTEVGEPVPTAAGDGSNSVWWKFDGLAGLVYTVSTAGSDFDTVVAVYTGASVGALTEIVSNDDDLPNVTSLASFAAVADDTYYVQVTGYSSSAFGAITVLVDSVFVPVVMAATWGALDAEMAADAHALVEAVLAASW